MSAVVVVPRRADGGRRDYLWRWCHDRWAYLAPGLPIVEGHDDGHGEFNRSLALNRGIRFAIDHHDPDVVVVVDADVWVGEGALERLVLVAALGRFTTGFHRYVHLGPVATDKVMAGWSIGWDTAHRSERLDIESSGLIGFTPDLWFKAGGFDERFHGWGWEDVAFQLACDAMVGPKIRLAGDLYHLHHPPQPDLLLTDQRNRHQIAPYLAAEGDPVAMARVIAR